MIINSNFNNFHCALIKLVSGEEIICHVEPEQYANPDDDLLVLYDPYIVSYNRESQLTHLMPWLIAASTPTHPIAKSDIMVRAMPGVKYRETYENLIDRLYNDEGDSDGLEPDEVLIAEGTNTIN